MEIKRPHLIELFLLTESSASATNRKWVEQQEKIIDNNYSPDNERRLTVVFNGRAFGGGAGYAHVWYADAVAGVGGHGGCHSPLAFRRTRRLK